MERPRRSLLASGPRDWRRQSEQEQAAALAVLALCGGKEALRVQVWGNSRFGSWQRHALEVLQDRRPGVASDVGGTQKLRPQPGTSPGDGMAADHERPLPAPGNRSVRQSAASLPPRRYHQQRCSLEQALRNNPAVLERVTGFFRFDVEAFGPNSGNLAEAIRSSALDGAIDREALLDLSLGAVASGFRGRSLPAFADFHEAMEPTRSEREARASAYIDLLGHRETQAVRYGLQRCRDSQKHGLLDETVCSTRAVCCSRARIEAPGQAAPRDPPADPRPKPGVEAGARSRGGLAHTGYTRGCGKARRVTHSDRPPRR